MCFLKICFKNRNGQAMFAAIFVLLIISILAIRFHLMSRDAEANAHRFQASEVAQQLAESAIDEAFEYVYKQTGISGSPWFKALRDKASSINCTSMSSMANIGDKGINIPVPLTLSAEKYMVMGTKFNIKVVARIIDFRNRGEHGNKFYGKEGVGTLEFKVKVTPKAKYAELLKSACVVIRDHDYKVVNIISSATRSGYASSFLLDYAFLIRNGYNEFLNTNGYSLNPSAHTLTIDTKGKGKVFIGGTEDPSKPVFLNIDKARKAFIPSKLKDTLAVTAGNNDILTIMKNFKKEMSDKFNVAVTSQGASFKGVSNFTGYKGIFKYERYPVTDNGIPTTSLKNIRDMASVGNTQYGDAFANFSPGITILPVANLAHVIQGNLRKRYFHYGYFNFDVMHAGFDYSYNYKGDYTKHVQMSETHNGKSYADPYKNKKYPCFLPQVDKKYPSPEISYGALYNKFIKTHPLIASDLRYDLPYVKNTSSSLTTPTFYNKKSQPTSVGGFGFLPYADVNLWGRRNLSQKMLEDLGIYDKAHNILNLRGIVYVNQKLTLGGKGPLTVKGQGVIIANGIIIKSGINATGNNICVLCTRGYPIVVETSQKITASLIAITMTSGFPGMVIANRVHLNLVGAFAVDELGLIDKNHVARWEPGKHKIVYDTRLSAGDKYQINISRWVNFEREFERE